MTVRYATHKDLPLIVELARAEHAASPWADTAFDADHLALTVVGFITEYGRTLLVSDRGYMAGLVQTLGFSPRLVALEYALYAEDGSGLQLVRRFEQWAEQMGATAAIVHDYAGGGRLGNVLANRYDYQPLGFALAKHMPARA